MGSSGNLAAYLFHQGTNYKAYEYFGCHKVEDGYAFRVFAPRARQIFVVGDFGAWREEFPMSRITSDGVWETVIPTDRVSVGDKYKYKIRSDGRECFKADPFAVCAECPPGTASIVCDVDGYEWRDSGWLAYRRKKAPNYRREPMNVYEVHLGSWKKREDGSALSYLELADELSTYVKQMGYTHIELMPVAEHPFGGSWGYQICSYFAPTARYGSPCDFMAFVDRMHEAGVGVILDWVPAHFPKDEHGLFEFDGSPLYEYSDPLRQEHKVWNTRYFDIGRSEVRSFLISNAIYWLEKYHVDALRVDAVSSMLYLDYDRGEGEWTPNVNGSNENLEAIDFFRALNSCVKKEFPDALMIAEESTAWPHVTSFENDGLGFDLKWNMGWSHDTLEYVRRDPIFRKYEHDKLIFSLSYAYAESYILPITHDDVVHCKGSLVGKMFGDTEKKLAGVRAYLGYMMTHPGKKLMFMGGEIGQMSEWDHDGSIEWECLEDEIHARLQYYVSQLNHLYLTKPALWQNDTERSGFEWICADDRDRSIISYLRRDSSGKEIIVVINFTPVAYEKYLVGVNKKGVYREIFNSDQTRFGGSGLVNPLNIDSKPVSVHGRESAIEINVAPFGVSLIELAK